MQHQVVVWREKKIQKKSQKKYQRGHREPLTLAGKEVEHWRCTFVGNKRRTKSSKESLRSMEYPVSAWLLSSHPWWELPSALQTKATVLRSIKSPLVSSAHLTGRKDLLLCTEETLLICSFIYFLLKKVVPSQRVPPGYVHTKHWLRRSCRKH